MFLRISVKNFKLSRKFFSRIGLFFNIVTMSFFFFFLSLRGSSWLSGTIEFDST